MTARTSARPSSKTHTTSSERKAARRRAAHRRVVRRQILVASLVVLAIAGLALVLRGPSPTSATSKVDSAALGAVADTPFPSSDGNDIRLSEFRGRPLVLYFYEGQACGACQTQLLEIEGRLADLRVQGASVLGVTTDPVDVSTSVASQLNLSYPILEDVDHQLGSAMGTFQASGHMGAVDEHSVVVLRADGTVAWRSLAGTTMYVAPDDIIRAVEAA